MKKRIGFVGLGIMGRPMAANLSAAGYELTVFNRTTERARVFVESTGASAVGSPAEAAENADVVITMLSDSPDVEEVVLGKSGVVEGAQPGLVVIDMSTISASVTQALAAELESRGVGMLDAPVSGGEGGAIAGTLTIMVGGRVDLFEQCLPILDVLGQTVTLFGGSGSGQLAKLCNQVICTGTLLAVCEGLLFASGAGLDPKTVISALSGGAAQSWMLANQGPKIIERDFTPGFLVKLEQKDLRLALDAAAERNLPLFGTAVAHELYKGVAAEEGGASLAHIALVKALERLAHHEVSKPVAAA